MRLIYKHVLGWCLYSIFLFLIFNLVTDPKSAYIRMIVILSTQIVVFYTNLKWLLPTFYEHKKYLLYGVFNLVLLFVGIVLNECSMALLPDDQLFELNLTEEELIAALPIYYMEMAFTHAMPIVLVIFVSLFIYSSKRKREQEEKELAIVTAEKNFLIQQINPHFLFNTLNNIYFLTYKNSPKGGEAIMQLSKMLDYSLYGAKEGMVSLKDEINYVNNFISLFKLKDSQINNISFEYAKANSLQKISPMLLLPFVENAIKHSNVESEESGFIRMELASEGNHIYFNCANSYAPKKVVDKSKGIGLANVKRRLELIYPRRHELEIKNGANEFTVSLKINPHA